MLVLSVLGILMVIPPVSVAAQTVLPKEMLRDVDVELNATATYRPNNAQPNIPDAPQPQSAKVRVVDKKFVAKYAAIYAAELLVTYELKKAHSWLPGDRTIRNFWFAYPTVMGTIHVKNGIRSIRTQAPGGCSAAECELQQ